MRVYTYLMTFKVLLSTGFCDSYLKGIIQSKTSWGLLFGQRMLLLLNEHSTQKEDICKLLLS